MSVVTIFNLVALLVTLAAVFGYLNHRWLRLPHTIGLVVISLMVSVALLLTDAVLPTLGLETTVRTMLTDIDFEDTLMKGFLSFLLFAGALHVDLDALLSRRWAISILATVGIVTCDVEGDLGAFAAADPVFLEALGRVGPVEVFEACD